MCELARNSVIQSGWEGSIKGHWLGHKWAQGINDVHRTNVPDLRIKYRQDTLRNELATLQRYVAYDKQTKHEEKMNMTLHDTVGLAGFAEPAKLQHHIHHDQHDTTTTDEAPKEDLHYLAAFPGAALAAERAKRKLSESGRSEEQQHSDH
jgi:AMP deaminase